MVTPRDKNLDINYEQLINKVNTENQEYECEDPEQNMIPYVKEHTLRLIKQISLMDQIDPQTVYIALAILIQSGGYLKGVSNRKAYLIDKNYELSKRTVINAMKASKCNCTLRTIAKFNRDTIAEIAYKRKIPGNLYTKYKINNPDILKASIETQWQHAKYCTDFQRENPNLPIEVLRFLSTREIKRKEK